MAVTGINYTEPDPTTYKSVYIHYGEGKEKIFNTGDFVKDWYDHTRYIIMTLSKKEAYFSGSSSIDHFIMDGAPYRSAWLIFDDTGARLSYNNKDFNHNIELFVHKGERPSWKTLKRKYNDSNTVECCEYYGFEERIMHCLKWDKLKFKDKISGQNNGYCQVNLLYECNKSRLHHNINK